MIIRKLRIKKFFNIGPAPNVIKLFTPCHLSKVFAPGRPFQTSLMFVCKAVAYPSEAAFRCSTLGQAPGQLRFESCKGSSVYLRVKKHTTLLQYGIKYFPYWQTPALVPNIRPGGYPIKLNFSVICTKIFTMYLHCNFFPKSDLIKLFTQKFLCNFVKM